MNRSKKECDKCCRLVSISNYKKHYNSCDGTYFTGPHKLTTEKQIKSVVTYNWCEIQKDYDAGLTYRAISQKYDMSMQSIANARNRGNITTRSISEAGKLYYKFNPPKKMGSEARKRQSKRMSEHNPGGKSKWFEINGKKVQGTWELNFAKHCNEKNLEWDRCTPWTYIIDGEEKRYTPDFYIPVKDLYIEIKGRWWGNDRKKMDCIIEQYPNRKILILEKDQYQKLLRGELVW